MPEFVDMSEEAFEEYYDSWALWVATERRFLPQPGGLDDQSSTQMQVFMELDSLLYKMKEQEEGEEDGNS